MIEAGKARWEFLFSFETIEIMVELANLRYGRRLTDKCEVNLVR
jgi:hypothetical protein